MVVAAVAASIKATNKYNSIKNSVKNQNSDFEAVPLKLKLCLIPVFTEMKNIRIRPLFSIDLSKPWRTLNMRETQKSNSEASKSQAAASIKVFPVPDTAALE